MHGRAQNRKRRIAICVVERNALASCYLHDILKRDPRVEILSEDSVLRSPAVYETSLPIFAIDAVTLSGSLVAYLTILRSRIRGARTLILGEELSRDELRRLTFLGIQGFVSYHEVKLRLRSALRAIFEGDTWFPPEALNEFVRHPGAFRPTSGSGMWEKGIFTQRERMIVGLVERRLGNKEIATVLNISESTVKFHLSNLFRKLGVHDRRSAATLITSPVLTFARSAPPTAGLSSDGLIATVGDNCMSNMTCDPATSKPVAG